MYSDITMPDLATNVARARILNTAGFQACLPKPWTFDGLPWLIGKRQRKSYWTKEAAKRSLARSETPTPAKARTVGRGRISGCFVVEVASRGVVVVDLKKRRLRLADVHRHPDNGIGTVPAALNARPRYNLFRAPALIEIWPRNRVDQQLGIDTKRGQSMGSQRTIPYCSAFWLRGRRYHGLHAAFADRGSGRR